MRSTVCFTLLVVTSLVCAACALDSSDCSFDGTCVPSATPGDGGTSGGVDAAAVPPNCKEDADAKDAPECMVDSFAVFVDGANGNDAHDGTMANPVKRIAKALTMGKRRVYVCGPGPYAEHLKPGGAVSVFGGWACDWKYDGTRAKVAPEDRGYVLHVENMAKPLTVSDVDILAPDVNQAKDGASSIAVFVNTSTVRFVRVSITAGAGADGANGEKGVEGVLEGVSSGDKTLAGNAGVDAGGGLFKECTCLPGALKSQGGGGGNAKSPGAPGLPALGGGGPGNGPADCGVGGSGSRGTSGADGENAVAITSRGALSAQGWAPARGIDATKNGGIGQGGGGGGGSDDSHGGGGGGCGGCGGMPGKGAQGGGGSIALLMLESVVSLAESKLVASAGGAGGVGGAGALGLNGGSPGIGLCPGGRGGNGGVGGAGGGGAGGVSIGVLYSKTAPTPDINLNDVQVGQAGAAGAGGKLTVNDGPPGLAEKVKDAAGL